MEGFHAHCLRHMPHPMADDALRIAFDAIQRATLADEDAVAAFLDGAHGRHFASDMLARIWPDGASCPDRPMPDAVAATVARWMGWSIDLQTARRFGIRHGQPYLTGWVTHYGLTGGTDTAPRLMISRDGTDGACDA